MTDYKNKTIQSILNNHSRYLKKWINILCNTEENYNIFLSGFLNMYDFEESLFKFQDYLKSNGRGQDISIRQIKECLLKKDSMRLKVLLEEILLKPIDTAEMKKLIQLRWKLDWENFIEHLKDYSNKRLINITDELGKYKLTKK